MFKVIIVDDEAIIRYGLRKIINWEQYECEVCGEAEDGTEGLELVNKCKPDIIITDIKMHEMDGLSMIREIKNILPRSKTIILTGYRDFDYAREALQLGAFDFILKPSRTEEINSVLRRAVQELRFQRDSAKEIDRLKVFFEQNIPMLREKMLYDTMYGINVDSEDIFAKMELYRINIGKFILIVIENDADGKAGDKSTEQYNRQLYQFGIKNFFAEAFAGYNIISISLNLERIAFIISLENNLDYGKLFDKLAQFQTSINNCFGFTISIGISTEGDSILQLPKKFKECQFALEHKLYLGNASLIFFEDLNSTFKYDDYSTLANYKEGLLDEIKLGNINGVKDSLSKISKCINELGNDINKDIKDFYWNTISSINNIRASVLSKEKPENMQSYRGMENLYHLFQECESIKDLDDIFKNICLQVAEKINSYNHKNINLKVQTMIDYVNEHYREPITLNDLSERIYASTYYASRIFKQETGKNFVDYLNEIRIEKAKVFLKDVRYKVYEVADLVGIPDAQYFSKMFKKYTGVSPKEFRDINLNEIT